MMKCCARIVFLCRRLPILCVLLAGSVLSSPVLAALSESVQGEAYGSGLCSVVFDVTTYTRRNGVQCEVTGAASIRCRGRHFVTKSGSAPLAAKPFCGAAETVQGFQTINTAADISNLTLTMSLLCADTAAGTQCWDVNVNAVESVVSNKYTYAVSLTLQAAVAADGDSDGVPDASDAFPTHIEATTDTDSDGKPNSIDTLKLPVFKDFESGAGSGWAFWSNYAANQWSVPETASNAWSGTHALYFSLAGNPTATPPSMANLKLTLTTGSSISWYQKVWNGYIAAYGFSVTGVSSKTCQSAGNGWEYCVANVTPGTNTLTINGSAASYPNTTVYMWMDDLRIGSALIEDTDDDNDGVADASDAFPLDASESVDTDGDGVGNNADPTPNGDIDGDGIDNLTDNCSTVANADQANTDGDSTGDACDADDDNDGIADIHDIYPLDASKSADSDTDSDGVDDTLDNCVALANTDQVNTDGDSEGNACDTDDDNDGVADVSDVFPLNPSESADTDGDGTGNNADPTPNGDADNDGVDNAADNCVSVANANQLNADGDAQGDACDVYSQNPLYSADTDRDTLPDNWEIAHGRDPAKANYAVSVAFSHTCAIDESGVKCWGGDNKKGQLNVPATLQNPYAVSTGTEWSCACDDNGSQCWGNGYPATPSCSVSTAGETASLLQGGVGFCQGHPQQPSQAPGFNVQSTCSLKNSGEVFCDTSGTYKTYPLTIPQPYQCVWTTTTITGEDKTFSPGHVRQLSQYNKSLCTLSDQGVTCSELSAGSGAVPVTSVSVMDTTPANLVIDSDGDGVPRPVDTNDLDASVSGDVDGDGIDSATDNCPTVANSDQADTDGDSEGDACDADDDNDGVVDASDAFPLDATEFTDTDGDGVGNNADTTPNGDTDGDGIDNSTDPTPNGDSDGDGVDNLVDNCPAVANADQVNADGDAQGDACDAFPLDASESVDTDGDDIGNNADSDDDNDGVSDVSDAFPLNAEASADTDGDGKPDSIDQTKLPVFIDFESGAGGSWVYTSSYAGNQWSVPDNINTAWSGTHSLYFSVARDQITHSGSSANLKLTMATGTSISWYQRGGGSGTFGSAYVYVNGQLGTCQSVGNNWSYCIKTVTPGTNTLTISGIALNYTGAGANIWIDDIRVGSSLVEDLDDDNDGVVDASDAFPLDATESTDTDGDGVGNNADPTPNGDTDGDGVDNLADNCPTVSNTSQADTDTDGVGDACDSTPNGDTDGDGIDNLADNCSAVANADQANADGDAQGDACDSTPNGDTDGDGVDNFADNCPSVANADQANADGDAQGDACDSTPNGDTDGDGVDNLADNCPAVANSDQLNTDGDAQGNVCDTDDDNDGVADASDAFPLDATESTDTDGDGVGNNADPTPNGDTDGDGIDNLADNCSTVANADQANADGDSQGDACDSTPNGDTDGDGVDNFADNCPSVANADQTNADGDAQGDACDALPNDATVLLQQYGTARNEHFGSSVTMTDMDNDGVVDVLVGVPQANVSVGGKTLKKAGAIRVVSGKNSAIVRELSGTAANQQWGTAIVAVPDQNSDGVADIVVGEPLANVTVETDGKTQTLKQAGRVALYSGSNGTLVTVLAEGQQAGGHFGAAVAVGQLDGDATLDLVVGAPSQDGQVKAGGQVFVYHGLAATQWYVRQGLGYFGAAVAVDGQQHLYVGAPWFSEYAAINNRIVKQAKAGRVWVYDGSDGDSGYLSSIGGNKTGGQFGIALAASPNSAQWAVGAALPDSPLKNAGSVTVFEGLNAAATNSINGANAGDYFGMALSLQGDVNQDSTNDLAIGVPYFDVRTTDAKPVLLKDAGGVTVLNGAGL